jgi:hypothetical protein
MYRNSLIHGDMVYTVEYHGTKFNWGVSKGLEHHFAYDHTKPDKRGQINIDVVQLCEDLLKFIETELQKEEEGLVEIEVGISNPPAYITSELDAIIEASSKKPSDGTTRDE